MHKHELVIRRIKLDTIVFAEQDSISELRITDLFLFNYIESMPTEDPFVLEHAFTPPQSSFQGERKFVPEYNHHMSAPEMLPPKNILRDNRRYYGQQADVWTLGCLIYNMVTGVPPFFNNDNSHKSEIYDKIRAGEWDTQFRDYHENATENLTSILSMCFKVDPEERISPADVINHPYFQLENMKYKSLPIKRVTEAFMSCRHFKPKYLF